ncbi:MAG: fluoride efflux transporter CrcB [Cardiobacteriaceae bacterium]|nr:fluoride efflux transporter CrcB [Cardiobacteriaceae bacterium]
MHLKILIYTFLGGGLGSICRYLTSYFINKNGSVFPLATLLVNLGGSLLIGLLAHALGRHHLEWRALLITGFCGGFTTFSTLSLESIQLWQTQHDTQLILYLCLSLVGGLLAAWAGLQLGRALLP